MHIKRPTLISIKKTIRNAQSPLPAALVLSRTTAAKTGMFILPSGGPVMTKVLRCSDMMPGCDYVARAETEDELMQKAAQHAQEKHGMQTVPPEVVQQIKSKIREE
jgi:predicted small metal-binding protein